MQILFSNLNSCTTVVRDRRQNVYTTLSFLRNFVLSNTHLNELVKMGVSRDNIEVVAKGGVADLTPISYNRRATVEIK